MLYVAAAELLFVAMFVVFNIDEGSFFIIHFKCDMSLKINK